MNRKDEKEINANHNHNPKNHAENNKKKEAPIIQPEDGIAEMDGGVMLTTSEILDFAQGADS